jgi:hypothetical protein
VRGVRWRMESWSTDEAVVEDLLTWVAGAVRPSRILRDRFPAQYYHAYLTEDGQETVLVATVTFPQQMQFNGCQSVPSEGGTSDTARPSCLWYVPCSTGAKCLLQRPASP